MYAQVEYSVKEDRAKTVNQTVAEQKELASRFNKVIKKYNEIVELEENVDNDECRDDKNQRQLIRNVCLAGGAPRDWKINQSAKDLDFFVNVIKIDQSLFYKLLGEEFGANKIQKFEIKEGVTYTRDFIKVCDIDIRDQTTIQIVCFKDHYFEDPMTDGEFGEKVIATFDLNINKCFAVFDDYDRLWFEYSDEYQSDVDNRKLTFNLTQMCRMSQYISLYKMPERIKRMKEKFKGFELEVV